jgi:hypothetical protein
VNIHLCDDRLKAIVPVVITLDKDEFTVKFSLKLTVALFSAFLPAFKDKISEKEYGIFGFYPVRDRKRFNLFFKYRFPIPVLRYFSRAKASPPFKEPSTYIISKGPRPFVDKTCPLLCSLKHFRKSSVQPVYHLPSFLLLNT